MGELVGPDQLFHVSDVLFGNLSRCLESDHFSVLERVLFLWNNDHLVNSGCLSRSNAGTVLPIVYGPLQQHSNGHWNATVEGLAQNVLKLYSEYDQTLYDTCTANHARDEEEAKRKFESPRGSLVRHRTRRIDQPTGDIRQLINTNKQPTNQTNKQTNYYYRTQLTKYYSMKRISNPSKQERKQIL